MLGFFKKTAQVVAQVAPQVIRAEKYTVEQIHDDFDTASQKVVDEANKILKSLGDVNIKNQVDALKAAGFHNVPIVKEWDVEAQKRRDAEHKITIVQRYAQKYPGQKFIFIEQVKEICNKYNLLCAPVSKYKGDVPQKNLLEINKFKALPEDTYSEEDGRISRAEFDFTRRHNFRNQIQLKDIQEAHRKRQEDIWKMDPRDWNMPSYGVPASFTTVPLFICAPKGDLTIDKDDKVSNDVFLSEEIKDPIVLHYVGDGFLIVTKWGLEGEDPSLVNEKMN